MNRRIMLLISTVLLCAALTIASLLISKSYQSATCGMNAGEPMAQVRATHEQEASRTVPQVKDRGFPLYYYRHCLPAPEGSGRYSLVDDSSVNYVHLAADAAIWAVVSVVLTAGLLAMKERRNG